MRNSKILYWLIPCLVVALCALGICYSLCAPSQGAQGASAGSAVSAVINPATAYIPHVTPGMLHYSRIRYAIHFAWIALDTAFLWAFLQLGWADDLRLLANSKSKYLIVRLAIFLVVFSLTMAVVLSPFSYVTGFWLKHHFGLSSQLLADWLIDWVKAYAVNFCVELPLWWLLYSVLRRFPKGWPILVFAGSVPIIFALTFLAPLVIDPVFNKIELMPDSNLRSNLQQLASAAGIPNAPIYTCDKHKQTKEVNAYVTGLGDSARIVLWDTTLEKLPPDEVICVVAHELGHYVLKHVYWGCAIAVLISLSLIPGNIWLTPLVFKNLPASWKVSSLNDFAGIPFLVLCATMASFVSEPLINGYSRSIEHEADMYGLNLTHNGPAFARTFASLSRDNLAEPAPPKFVELWLFSHPSLSERIESALKP